MIDFVGQMKSIDKTIDIISKGLRGNLRHISPYPFHPEKTKYPAEPSRRPLPRSAPEAQGVPSSHLERFFRELDECPDIKVHSVMVLRHGTLIGQANWRPYSGIYAQMVYSMSKSVTAMAVGMAVQEGLFTLENQITQLFSDKLPPFYKNRLNQITVRHLLNMTSGIRFNEVNTVFEQDWVKAYFSSDCSFEPGSEFAYNSLNSYLLSALVCKKAGQGLVEYLRPRLFEPLGIDHVVWEKCPMGIEKGGWGLFLRPEDMAKLGQLYLQKGMWMVDDQPRQLLPRKWVEDSTDFQVKAAMGKHQTKYGYHLWSFPIPNSYQCNGVFGQYVVILPDLDAVIAITSGSHGLFIDESASIIQRFFGSGVSFSSSPLAPNPNGVRALKRTTAAFTLFPDTVPVRRPLTLLQKVKKTLLGQQPEQKINPDAALLNGRTYPLQNAHGSVLPFVFSVERNSFLPPANQVKFAFAPDFCTIEFSRDEERQVIRAGLDGEPRRCLLNINGEAFMTGNLARLTRDEDGRPVLKLYISFLETPNTRVIKFIFSGDRLLIRFGEIPSVDDASRLLMSLANGGGAMEKLLIEKLNEKQLSAYIRRITVPKARGTRNLEAE